MPKLTKRVVEKAEPVGRDSFVWCSELPGFGVRVFASGRRSYLVQYRAEGRTRRVAIGVHGVVTCEEARKRARELLGNVAAGGNPAEEKASARKATTVRELCELYLAAIEKGLIFGKRGLPKKPSTMVSDRGRITRHILPLLGGRRVRDLTTPDISRFMRDVAAGKTAIDERTAAGVRVRVTGGKGAAGRTVGLLGGILSYAVTEGIISANPVRGVKRPADESREVRLSVGQYRALGKALEAAELAGARWQPIVAIKLLALTGCRRGEIENLTWADVDLAGRCLRLSDSKAGKSVRPLGAAARSILSDLRQDGPFVFPGRPSGQPFAGVSKPWLRIIDRAVQETDCANEAELAALARLIPHGLRHAFASVAGDDLGMTEITIGALLGHSSASVTSRYIHQVDATLIAAADRVAGRIASAMTGQDEGATVVRLRAEI